MRTDGIDFVESFISTDSVFVLPRKFSSSRDRTSVSKPPLASACSSVVSAVNSDERSVAALCRMLSRASVALSHVPFTFAAARDSGGPVAFTDHTSRVQSRPPEPVDGDASTVRPPSSQRAIASGASKTGWTSGSGSGGTEATLDASLSTRHSQRSSSHASIVVWARSITLSPGTKLSALLTSAEICVASTQTHSAVSTSAKSRSAVHGKYSPASLPAWSDAASRSTRIFSPVDVNRADSTFGGGPVRSRTFSHDSSVGPDVGLGTTP